MFSILKKRKVLISYSSLKIFTLFIYVCAHNVPMWCTCGGRGTVCGVSFFLLPGMTQKSDSGTQA